jgi:hypothetical protein
MICGQPVLVTYEIARRTGRPQHSLMDCERTAVWQLESPDGRRFGRACDIHRRDLEVYAAQFPDLGRKVVGV